MTFDPDEASTVDAEPQRPGRVLLARPRGYCAGVDRAVQTVEQALDHYGAPLYVRKQIVHKNAQRPAVRDRVMNGKDDNMMVGRAAKDQK